MKECKKEGRKEEKWRKSQGFGNHVSSIMMLMMHKKYVTEMGSSVQRHQEHRPSHFSAPLVAFQHISHCRHGNGQCYITGSQK